jgi:FecR protein
MSPRWILCWALTPLLGLPALAQSVISAHSGLIHFADGSVFLDDQRVEQKAGKFDQMKNGSELRTQDGRAEVLLTPGTFLRIGTDSAIRMISNDLDNTRVELLNGSAVLDQGSDTLANTSVTILYNLDQVRIKKPGRYRFDSQPPQVKVESGDVDVTAADGKSVEAGAGYAVAFEGKLTARKLLGDSGLNGSTLNHSGDDLDNWDSARNHAVADSNLDAAAATDLSGAIDSWQNDPDAVLQALGIPPYPPGMSSYIPPYAYGSGLYGPGLYGPGVYGAGLGYAPYGPYGLAGFGSPLALYYGAPLYLPYRYSYSALGLGYRGGIVPGRIGVGRPLYQSPGVIRLGVGVGHPGAVHVGGHR